jgi:hypothetical protein
MHVAVSFEAFMAVMFQAGVFWVVTPCSVIAGYPEDGDSIDICNDGILPQRYTVSKPQQSSISMHATTCSLSLSLSPVKFRLLSSILQK